MIPRTPLLFINGILLLAALGGLFFTSVEISGFNSGGRISALRAYGVVDMKKAATIRPEWDGFDATSEIGRWVATHDRRVLTLVSAVALVASSLNLWLLRSRN